MALKLNSRYTRALVTGASSGLGLAFAEMLLAEGVEVWATARSTERLMSRDGLHPMELDLASDASLGQFISRVRDTLPDLDLLVNNAGYGGFFPFEQYPESEIIDQVGVLLTGPVRICRSVYESMRARGKGVIVNVSSLAAEFPLPYMSMYNAGKSGLSGFSRSLMLESVGSGVVVIDFQPGDFRTSFNTSVLRSSDADEQRDTVRRAWEKIDKYFQEAPTVDVAAARLRSALARPQSDTVRTGAPFQSVVAPFLSRFVSRRTLNFFIRKYYRLP